MENIHILAFYKYVEILDYDKFAVEHLKFCKKLGLLGRILVGKEGINGSISGLKEQIEKYKKNMHSDLRFKNMMFKEDIGLTYPFTQMVVRSREEVVAFGVKVDMDKTGKYLTSEEFLKIYDNGKVKDYIILDARNDYEYKVGRFKNAIHLSIKTFRQFPESVKKIENLKDKQIIMYCTGGIRCEKASAYLKDQGFENVSQLHGGIINFGKQFPDTVWEGKCFVFDKRLVVPINNKENTPITKCEICEKDCDLYRNCRNVNCDKLFISCIKCDKDMNGCCCDECLQEFRKQCMEKSARKQNRREINVIELENTN